MDGKEVVRIIEKELFQKGISKADFYEACGMNSATMSNWRKNVFQPSAAKLTIIENYLGIHFADYEKSQVNNDDLELLQWIREDFSHRALFESVKTLTAEQLYTAASFVEKLKAGDK